MRHRLLTAFNGATVNPLASVPWVAQWKFNNNANDSIGSNNLTASVSSPTFTTGLLGGATGATALASASSQFWSLASSANFQAANVDQFWAAWVYLTDKTATQTILSKRDDAATAEYILRYSNPADRFQFLWSTDGGGTAITVSANNFGSPTAATWYLVCAWRVASTGTIYISVNNGTADSAGSASTFNASTADFRIGQYQAVNYWNGRIDCVGYARGVGAVLTAAQMAALYNSGTGTENFS